MGCSMARQSRVAAHRTGHVAGAVAQVERERRFRTGQRKLDGIGVPVGIGNDEDSHAGGTAFHFGLGQPQISASAAASVRVTSIASR